MATEFPKPYSLSLSLHFISPLFLSVHHHSFFLFLFYVFYMRTFLSCCSVCCFVLGTYAAEVTEEEEKEVDPIISVSGFAYIDMQVSIYLSLKMYALIAIVYHQHVAISNSLICFVVSYIYSYHCYYTVLMVLSPCSYTCS